MSWSLMSGSQKEEGNEEEKKGASSLNLQEATPAREINAYNNGKRFDDNGTTSFSTSLLSEATISDQSTDPNIWRTASSLPNLVPTSYVQGNPKTCAQLACPAAGNEKWVTATVFRGEIDGS